MGIDLDLIDQRLAYIVRWLRELEELSRADRETFAKDEIRAAAAESYLRRSLEAVFDIGRHILAKTGHTDLAGEYKSIARGLVDIGAVEPSLGERLVKMAGYRNRLVHLYDEITNDELHLIVTTGLEDLRAFVRAIRDHLKA